MIAAVIAMAADRERWGAKLPLTAIACLAMGWVLTLGVIDVPWQVIAYGRRIAPIMRGIDLYRDTPTKVLFRGEGNDRRADGRTGRVGT